MEYIIPDLVASDRNMTQTSFGNKGTFWGSHNHGVTCDLKLENWMMDSISAPSLTCSLSLILSDLCFSLHGNLILSNWFSLQRWIYAPKSSRLLFSLHYHLRKSLLSSSSKNPKELFWLVWFGSRVHSLDQLLQSMGTMPEWGGQSSPNEGGLFLEEGRSAGRTE